MAKDHFVARTYLKRWCDRPAGRQLQVYRKPSGATFECWPEAVCAESDGDLNPLYFEDPNVLGQFRAIFEPHWDEAVEAIEARRPEPDHKFVIAGYWANLLSMTPAWRKIGQELYEREIQSILPIIAKGQAPPEKLKNLKLSIEIDENYVKAVATKQLLAGALQLYHQPWTILVNDTAHKFLTSDNPSAIYPPPAPGGVVVRILPLSPTLCVSTIMERRPQLRAMTATDFAAAPKGWLTYHAVEPAGVKLANRLTVVNAERFVFAATANVGISALVKKYGDYCAQLEHSATSKEDGTGLETKVRVFVGNKK